MLLSARMLNSVCDANSFEYVDTAQLTEGDATTLYFQIIDASKDRAEKGFVPAGRRYLPATGATLSVTLDNIDMARKVIRGATQPFPLDPSIWSIPILSTDKIRGTVTMKLTLTEGGNVTNGILQNALSVTMLDGKTRI